ncbi:hypothetical protein [Paraburkholderia gardini]|nr:hypothetical protein [Paraburkholderia gardini]
MKLRPLHRFQMAKRRGQNGALLPAPRLPHEPGASGKRRRQPGQRGPADGRTRNIRFGIVMPPVFAKAQQQKFIDFSANFRHAVPNPTEASRFLAALKQVHGLSYLRDHRLHG